MSNPIMEGANCAYCGGPLRRNDRSQSAMCDECLTRASGPGAVDRAAAVFHVYVPKPRELPTIVVGSGIVGVPTSGPGTLLIDYEGNLYGAANVVTFGDRVYHAASRQATRYPTVARMLVPEDKLICVGVFNGHRVDVFDDGAEPLARWLSVVGDVPDAELVRSDR